MNRQPYQQINPAKVREDIKSILHSFPTWDGEDHIKQYAQQLNVEHWKRGEFNESFRRWFTAMVRNVMDDNFTALQCLCLVGLHGNEKSLFISNLFPRALYEHYSTFYQLDFTSSKCIYDLCTNLVIALNAGVITYTDDFFTIGQCANYKFKFNGTETRTEVKRLASYILATKSGDPFQLIKSSNWDVFVIKSFELDNLINKKQLFSQAMTVLGYK